MPFKWKCRGNVLKLDWSSLSYIRVKQEIVLSATVVPNAKFNEKEINVNSIL